MTKHRNSELTLWRFGAALMGGRTLLWMVAVAMLVGVSCAIYVLLQPTLRYKNLLLVATIAAFCASGAFLMMPLAAAQLWAQQRRHPLLVLTPGGDARLRALLWRIALLAAISFVPALVLRVFVNVLDRSNLLATVSLASADAYVWRGWALYLLAAAALILYMGCGMRTPTALMAVPIQMFSMQLNLRMWWMPPVACAMLIVVPLLYRRLTGAEPPRRPRMVDDNVYLVTEANRVPGRVGQLLARWRAYRLRRLINAGKGARATTLALLGGDQRWMTSFWLPLVLAFVVAFFQPLSPSQWGASHNLFFAMIAGFATMPGPVALTSVWLLPVGLNRALMGETLVAVWMHRARVSIGVGVALGALFLLLMHAIDPAWPEWRNYGNGARTLSEKLLWAPLAVAFALHGIAYTSGALYALSPRLLAAGVRWFPAASVFVTPIVAGGGMVLADMLTTYWKGKLGTGAGVTPLMIYLLLFGAVLPVLAWLLLRARRSAWQRADIAAIAARMAEWSKSIQRGLASDRDMVIRVVDNPRKA